jgi:asparagine synthase (glutamine-hydrolysing)
MCGIAGFVNAAASVQQQQSWIDSMAETLSHRGPDGGGVWTDGTVALGHRRLSIIDLESGAQPMLDWDERAVIVFNGEIYNFTEVRERLEKKGFRFRTHSDTEVLLDAYLDAGPACLSLLEGMFAFAIWDRKARTLFAARDRMGKKPFYYTLQNGVFAFASELSAFSRLPFLKLETKRESISRFLAYEYIPTPESIYDGVFKLRPGHHLIFSEGRMRTTRYWDLPLPDMEHKLSIDECCERLRYLAARAVRRRLVSDVPLGVFLSGGIDSSTIVALMSEQVLPREIKTFSIGFKESTYDESPYARLVARRFGTDHHEHILSAIQAVNLLPAIISRQDEPLADPSVVPTYLLSQVTRRTVTVALGGDGGDELFAGYEYFLGFMLAEYYSRLPRLLRKSFIEPVSRLLPMSTGYVSLRNVVEKFLLGIAAPRWLRTQIWLGSFSPEVQQSIWEDPPYTASDLDGLYGETRALFARHSVRDPIDGLFYFFARQYLLDDILVKVDRCSMMHSLEVRAPFLDTDLVEFVSRLPYRLKMRNGRRKYLLKRAFSGILPRRVVHRAKRGFLIPTALWLQGPLRPLVEEYLGENRLKRQGLFKPAAVRRLLEEHSSGRADRRKEIWTLLNLQLWLHCRQPTII